MSQDMPPPLAYAEPAAWYAYSDWLLENDVSSYCKIRVRSARRIAKALEECQQLVLVCDLRAPQVSQWFSITVLRPDCLRHFNWAQIDCQLYRDFRWWTVKFAAEFARRKVLPYGIVPAVPADFSGLIEHVPHLAWAFYWTLVRNRDRRRPRRK
jgi:hypothetical protein